MKIYSRWDSDRVLHEHDGETLRGADLEGAWLAGADLEGAWLRGARLQRAQLQGAQLQDAQLEGAQLQGANLRGAWLRGARLQRAWLQGANLEYARLEGANLEGADLVGAVLPDGRTLEEYIKWLPEGLLLQGGKTLAEVAAAWGEHSWTSCPMSVAFNASSLSDVPECHRAAASLFVALFDGKHLPRPQLT